MEENAVYNMRLTVSSWIQKLASCALFTLLSAKKHVIKSDKLLMEHITDGGFSCNIAGIF